MVDARTKGRITVQYTVWCGRCQKPEMLKTKKIQRVRYEVMEMLGYIEDDKDGLVCSRCKVEQKEDLQ